MQNIFEFIIHPMELALIWLCLLVGGAGIGIILFTIFVRLVLSPLQIVQLRNAKSMQRIQPLVAELKKKHGKDREKLTQATMALYKEHRVNPAMGCLPTLLQFPILIGLFYALLHLGASPVGYPGAISWAKSACNGHVVHNWGEWYQYCYQVKDMSSTAKHIFDLFHADFLWLSHGLGKPDPLFILPILAGVTQWIQSRMMLTQSTDPQQQMMNKMTNFFPLMIIFFAANYPSGLSLYWVTSTMIGILIQYRITGLGLLRETRLPRMAALVGGGTGTQRRPAPVKPRRSATVEPANTDGNGPQSGSAGALPVEKARKKANRAKGGGRGGRRR